MTNRDYLLHVSYNALRELIETCKRWSYTDANTGRSVFTICWLFIRSRYTYIAHLYKWQGAASSCVVALHSDSMLYRLMRLSVSSLRLFIRLPCRDCASPAGNASCARVCCIIINMPDLETFSLSRYVPDFVDRRDDCLIAQVTQLASRDRQRF